MSFKVPRQYRMRTFVIGCFVLSCIVAWQSQLRSGVYAERQMRARDLALVQEIGGEITGWSDKHLVRVAGVSLWAKGNRGGASHARFANVDFTEQSKVEKIEDFLYRNPQLEQLHFSKCKELSEILPLIFRLDSLSELGLDNCVLVEDERQNLLKQNPELKIWER